MWVNYPKRQQILKIEYDIPRTGRARWAFGASWCEEGRARTKGKRSLSGRSESIRRFSGKPPSPSFFLGFFLIIRKRKSDNGIQRRMENHFVGGDNYRAGGFISGVGGERGRRRIMSEWVSLTVSGGFRRFSIVREEAPMFFHGYTFWLCIWVGSIYILEDLWVNDFLTRRICGRVLFICLIDITYF